MIVSPEQTHHKQISNQSFKFGSTFTSAGTSHAPTILANIEKESINGSIGGCGPTEQQLLSKDSYQPNSMVLSRDDDHEDSETPRSCTQDLHVSNTNVEDSQKVQTRYIQVEDGIEDCIDKNSGEGTINYIGNVDSQ